MIDKLKLHTPDFIQENIARLAELFPNCVTESRTDDGALKRAIDFDQLRQELSEHIADGPRERYQLNWPGKREALLAANTPIAKTLRPSREESVAFDTTKNLFIEGDNLDALKLLQETYLSKVRLIYIDPPYNTGNDFIYDDDFSDSVENYLLRSNQEDEGGKRLVVNQESNGRFHSDWLSMMYPRLKLARNLLSEEGAIFISIDEGEAFNLHKVCSEVFGEANFVTAIIWHKRVSPANDSKYFSSDHDLILVFAKNKDVWRPERLPLNDEQKENYSNPDNDGRGPWNSSAYTCAKTADERPNLYYPLTQPTTGEEIWPDKARVWAFEKATHLAHLANRMIYWGKDGLSTKPRLKKFLSDAKPVVPRSVWMHGDVGSNAEANMELKDLFDDQVFSAPKPVRLLVRLAELSTSQDAIVLDFFGGSGTMAHAVMQLNAKDAGTRRHVTVQLAEQCDENSAAFRKGYRTIADIAKERIRRAGNKIKSDSGLQGQNLDIGFRVLKVDSSNMKDVYYKPDALDRNDLFDHVQNIKEDRTPEDLLFQVLLDWGVDLSLPMAQETIDDKAVFFVDGNALAACFDTGVTEELVKKIAARKPLRAVFRDAGFNGDSVKINVEQIFKLMSPGTEVKAI